MKLSDYLMQRLAAEGVRHLFMLPGGGAMHLVDSAGRVEGMGYVPVLHEQAGTIAAEAYGRATNNLGVMLVTSGPGGINALTGVAGAYLATSPLLVLSGQAKRSDLKGASGLRQLGSQEVDIVAMAAPITKYAVQILEPASIRFHLEKALAEARTGRKGPVWLDIPLDVQAAEIDPSILEGYVPAPEPGTEDLPERAEEVLALLAEARRPVFLAGNGVHAAGGEEVFRRLAERLGIPVLTTWGGCDLLPGDHPLAFGRPGPVAARGSNFVLQNSDFLLSVGARLDFETTGFNQAQYARAARKVVVDLDPAETAKLRMKIDLILRADCKAVLEALEVRAVPVPRPDWLERCRAWIRTYPLLEEGPAPEDRINPFRFHALLSELLAEGDLVVPCSSGAATDMFWMVYRAKPGQRAFSTGGLGAMGFGLSAAMGGCLALGGKRTISLEGDGGALLNVQEMATLARLGLPIKYFVLNNGGYLSIRNMQRTHFQSRLVACDASSGLPMPDIVKVAQAFGLPARRIDRPEGLREAIREVLESEGPQVCDVVLDPEVPLAPRVSSRVTADGSMASSPLEDLWPFLDREELRANLLIPPLP
jgi:acetolactate synthase-1/2/3 large subunit